MTNIKNKDDLYRLMQDKRYWKLKDPEYMKMVQQAFRDYYGDGIASYDDTGKINMNSELARAEQGRVVNENGGNGYEHKVDTEIGHLMPGEIVIPPHFQTAEVMSLLRRTFGTELARYTVGSGYEVRNPTSGLIAFSPEAETEGSVWEYVPEVVRRWVNNYSTRSISAPGIGRDNRLGGPKKPVKGFVPPVIDMNSTIDRKTRNMLEKDILRGGYGHREIFIKDLEREPEF